MSRIAPPGVSPETPWTLFSLNVVRVMEWVELADVLMYNAPPPIGPFPVVLTTSFCENTESVMVRLLATGTMVGGTEVVVTVVLAVTLGVTVVVPVVVTVGRLVVVVVVVVVAVVVTVVVRDAVDVDVTVVVRDAVADAVAGADAVDPLMPVYEKIAMAPPGLAAELLPLKVQ